MVPAVPVGPRDVARGHQHIGAGDVRHGGVAGVDLVCSDVGGGPAIAGLGVPQRLLADPAGRHDLADDGEVANGVLGPLAGAHVEVDRDGVGVLAAAECEVGVEPLRRVVRADGHAGRDDVVVAVDRLQLGPRLTREGEHVLGLTAEEQFDVGLVVELPLGDLALVAKRELAHVRAPGPDVLGLCRRARAVVAGLGRALGRPLRGHAEHHDDVLAGRTQTRHLRIETSEVVRRRRRLQVTPGGPAVPEPDGPEGRRRVVRQRVVDVQTEQARADGDGSRQWGGRQTRGRPRRSGLCGRGGTETCDQGQRRRERGAAECGAKRKRHGKPLGQAALNAPAS